MPKAWSEKRERQYEHVKESLEDQGRSRFSLQAFGITPPSLA